MVDTYEIFMASRSLRRVLCISLMTVGGAGVTLACESVPSDKPNLDGGSSPAADSGVEASTDAAIDTGSDAGDAGTDANVDASDGSTVGTVVADLVEDFATAANPHGVWTYGYSLGDPRGDAGSFVVFSTASELATNIPYWYDPAHQVLNDPCIYRNGTNAVFADGVQPGDVALHPGAADEYAIARFTAPTAGTFAITVRFKEGDTGDTNGLVLHNGTVIAEEASTTTNPLHDLVRTLAAGDTIDVAVGNKGDFTDDSTPVEFVVRAATSP